MSLLFFLFDFLKKLIKIKLRRRSSGGRAGES